MAIVAIIPPRKNLPQVADACRVTKPGRVPAFHVFDNSRISPMTNYYRNTGYHGSDNFRTEWTAEEDKMIMENTEDDAALSFRVKRTIHAIHQRRSTIRSSQFSHSATARDIWVSSVA